MSKLNEFNLDDFFDEKDALEAVNEVGARRFWRPKTDTTKIRVLPPIKTNGERLFYFTHKVHWINRVPYECIDQTLVDKDGKEHVAETCPICTLAKQLYKLGEKDEEARKEASAISAKRKDVVRILVRDGGDLKVQFYEMPISVRNLFVTAISSGDFGEPPIHPVKGNDLSLQRTGSGQQTKYESSYIIPKKTALAQTKEEIINILKEAEKMPYNSILSFMPASELKRVLREYSGDPAPVVKTDTPTETVTEQVVGQPDIPEPEPKPETVAKKKVEIEQDEDSALDDLLSELNGLDGDEDIPF